MWSYCSGMEEFAVNECFMTDGSFIIVTEDFIATAERDGIRMRVATVVETGDVFPEKREDRDAFVSSLKVAMNVEGTYILKWTSEAGCLYDVASRSAYALPKGVDCGRIRGFAGERILLTSVGGQNESFQVGDTTFSLRGKSISSQDLIALYGNRVYAKSSSGGIYSMVIGDGGDELVNFDSVTSQPIYTGERYAVFSMDDGKAVLDFADGTLTPIGSFVSGRLRASNLHYATDDFIVTKNSKDEVAVYSVSADAAIALPRSEPEYFDSAFDHMLVMQDKTGAYYCFTGTDCELAKSTDGLPKEGVSFIVRHKAGVQYTVVGFDAMGSVYEYEVDLLS